jgi:hypothetical protein
VARLGARLSANSTILPRYITAMRVAMGDDREIVRDEHTTARASLQIAQRFTTAPGSTSSAEPARRRR